MAARTARKAIEKEETPVPLKLARNILGELSDIAHFRDRRVPITKRGKEYAALIGLSDLEKLRKLDGAA